jgi:hypothetical protein
MKKILIILSLAFLSFNLYSQNIDYNEHSKLSILFESSPRQELKSNTQIGILTQYYGNYIGLRTYKDNPNTFLSITMLGRVPLLEDNKFSLCPFLNITFDKEISYGMKWFVEPIPILDAGISFSNTEVSLCFMVNFNVEGTKHYIHQRHKR